MISTSSPLLVLCICKSPVIWLHSTILIILSSHAHGSLCLYLMEFCIKLKEKIRMYALSLSHLHNEPQIWCKWWYHDDVIKWKHFPRFWPFVRVPGDFPTQRPVMRNFDVFFDLRPNIRLSKHWWGWWFETPSHQLWRHCNAQCKYYWFFGAQSVSMFISTINNYWSSQWITTYRRQIITRTIDDSVHWRI